MTVAIRRRGAFWQYQIHTRGPDGPITERRNAPDACRTEIAARRYAEARERHLIAHGQEKPRPASKTLAEWLPQWLEHCRANRMRPSTLNAYEARSKHLAILGDLNLDQIDAAAISKLTSSLAALKPLSVNHVLYVLAAALRAAAEWGHIERAIRINYLKVELRTRARFYDFPEWEQLVQGAAKAGPEVLAFVLLAGEAGLRRGEIVALEWGDVRPGAIVVSRSDWKGQIGSTKSGKLRRVPTTTRLAAALEALRHLRGPRVFCHTAGSPVTAKTLRNWLHRAQRRAGLPIDDDIHKLRHTFGSHLAMRGATVTDIRDLLGHASLSMTQLYMHLSPAHKEQAIRLLEPAWNEGSESASAQRETEQMKKL